MAPSQLWATSPQFGRGNGERWRFEVFAAQEKQHAVEKISENFVHFTGLFYTENIRWSFLYENNIKQNYMVNALLFEKSSKKQDFRTLRQFGTHYIVYM
jgi:hypothetical protein